MTARPVDLFDVPAMPEPVRDAVTVDATLIETDDDELIDVTEGECCEGHALELRCKLCKQSPTYWRLTEGVP